MGKKRKLPAYPADMSLGQAQRMAHFFNWFANQRPKTLLSLPEVWRVINNLSDMPNPEGDEIVKAKRILARCRNVLYDTYRKRIIAERRSVTVEFKDGRKKQEVKVTGYRASVDTTDLVVNDLPSRRNRLRSAQRQYIMTTNLLQPSKMSKAPELRAHREHLLDKVPKMAKILESKQFQALCEGPPRIPATTGETAKK
jgi:hypothetical protein